MNDIWPYLLLFVYLGFWAGISWEARKWRNNADDYRLINSGGRRFKVARWEDWR